MSNTNFLKTVEELITLRSENVQIGLRALLSNLRVLEDQLKIIEDRITAISKADKDIQLLKSIPGVGNLTALAFKIFIGDPKRFKTSRAVGAYFGMTPKQYSSGETQKQGRVSKRGQTEMRFLLNEAAGSLLNATKSWSKIKAWGIKIRKKKGHKKATMAVGRKLATIMHRMLITRETFRYGAEKQAA